jgi:hypothetical protein
LIELTPFEMSKSIMAAKYLLSAIMSCTSQNEASHVLCCETKDFWRSRTQEKLYPKYWVRYFPWRSRTRVRFLQEKSYLGTTFPGEIILINIRVRVLLENLYPPNLVIFSHKILGRLLLRKNLAIFSHKIVGTSSPLEKLCHF